jgi:tetratricopeptide (TPR) repeat protein
MTDLMNPIAECTDDDYIQFIQHIRDEYPHAEIPAEIWFGLGELLDERSLKTGSMSDLTAAIGAFKEAVVSSNEGDPDRAERLDRLSISLQLRAKFTKSVEDATAAITYAFAALFSLPGAPRADPAPLCLSFAKATQLRSELTGCLDDLNKIILFLATAVKSIPKVDRNGRAMLFESIATSISRRIELTRKNKSEDEADLELLFRMRVTVCQLTPRDDEHWLGRQHNLATAYMFRYMRKETFADLDVAANILEEILKLMPPDHQFRRHCLQTQATCLQLRLGSGDMRTDRNVILQSLDESISLARGRDYHDPAHTSARFTRASALLESYQLTGSLDDLETAANELLGLSTSAKTDQDPLLVSILNNLGAACLYKAARFRSSSDLDAAIGAFRTVAQARDPLERGNAWSNLGNALMTRYSWCSEGFSETSDALNEALSLAPKNSNDYCLLLSKIGALYHMRFDKTGTLKDLWVAEVCQRKAAERSCTDLYQASLFNDLGITLRAISDTIDSEDALNDAVGAYESGLACIQSPPWQRMVCAMRGAILAAPKNPRRASRLATAAIRLLSNTSPRILSRDDQQYSLSQFNGLATVAAILAVSAGESDFEAMRILELGRGVMISNELEMRSDISDLEVSYPSLATQFTTLREKLSIPLDTISKYIGIRTSGLGSAGRHATSQQLDNIIELIRTKEGFDNFLLGPSITELKALASDGPVVYLVASDLGSGSFLVTTTGVKYLPLPKLKEEDVRAYAKILAGALEHTILTRRRSLKPMRKILMWLWDVAIEPILQQLGFTNTPQHEDHWPHVWWIPVGSLTLFPIHAAGYFPNNGSNTLDRVISSYVPTIKALGYARGRCTRRKRAESSQTVLMAVMSETPQKDPLPFARKEVNDIDALLPRSIPREILARPTKSELLGKIEKCSVAHFSCHGGTDPNPSKSQIYLEDWQTDPLMVSDIARLRLDRPQLAYISACYAAHNSAPELLDEAIHMAGACQLAGFPSVIGTLWQASDLQSAIITGQFYRSLLDKNDKFDFSKVAKALHFAVRNIRNANSQGLDEPLVWAPYIHVGV